MQLPVTIRTYVYILIVAVITVNQISANPIPPMPITEVEIKDTQHWTIEVDGRQLGFYGDNPVPNQTDTITLCIADYKKEVSKDSLKNCTEPIQFNTSTGFGLITEKNFPEVKLKAGMAIFIG